MSAPASGIRKNRALAARGRTLGRSVELRLLAIFTSPSGRIAWVRLTDGRVPSRVANLSAPQTLPGAQYARREEITGPRRVSHVAPAIALPPSTWVTWTRRSLL